MILFCFMIQIPSSKTSTKTNNSASKDDFSKYEGVYFWSLVLSDFFHFVELNCELDEIERTRGILALVWFEDLSFELW